MTFGVLGAETVTKEAASLHAPAALSRLYVRTLQNHVPEAKVPAGALYSLAEPVTVVSAVQVLPSALFCSSALVCALPLSLMCVQRKLIGWSPSRRLPDGSSAVAVGTVSRVSNDDHAV